MPRTCTFLSGVTAGLTLAALAGCGTTVPASQLAGAGADGGLGTLADSNPSAVAPGEESTSAGSPYSGGLVTGSGTTTVTGAAGPSVGTNARTGAGSPASSLPTLAPGQSGQGFTKTTVKIGISTADDSQAAITAFGVKGLDPGDYKGQLKAVVDNLNKRGGLAGRKVELVAHDFNTTQLVTDAQSANQAACATWTQDNKVLAVLLPPIVTENLLACLKKAGTPIVGAGIEFPRTYQAIYDKYPDYFQLGAMVGELYDQLSVSRLAARGYFTGWDTVLGKPGDKPVKVGVIVRNDTAGAQQEASIKRALAKHGITAVSYDHCTSGVATSCMQNVELRYQTNGVTHVFGNSDLTFMNTAESQNYHPRYFMPGTLDTFANNAPKGQLASAMAESFTPTADVPQAKDPGPPTKATTTCFSIMRAAGQNAADNRTAQLGMQSICDAFFFLEAAVKLRGGLSDDVVRTGFEALGSSVPSAATWAVRLAPGQHAAVYGLRDLAFDTECGCFAYLSTVTHTR